MTLIAFVLGWIVLSIPTALIVAAIIGSNARSPVVAPAGGPRKTARGGHSLPRAA